MKETKKTTNKKAAPKKAETAKKTVAARVVAAPKVVATKSKAAPAAKSTKTTAVAKKISAINKVEEKMTELKINEALAEIMEVYKRCNKYVFSYGEINFN